MAADEGCRNSAARAKAKRGWSEISSGLVGWCTPAKLPTMTAVAPDASAGSRFLSSSTKTRSLLEAAPMLEIPLTVTVASPSTRATTKEATSARERCMVTLVYEERVQEKW